MPDPQWGAPVPVKSGWGTPVPVKAEPTKEPSLLDMFRPTDPAGNKFTPHLPIPKIPRAAGPVLAMVSALLTRGLSLPAQVAAGTLAGTAGEGVDELTHGDDLSLGNMAGEGALQGAFSATPGLPRGLKIAGDAMQGVKVGPLSGAAVAHMAGAPPWAAAAVGSHVAPIVERGVSAAGRGASVVADALEPIAGAKTLATERAGNVGGVLPASRVPALPDALRKIQLLVRALSPQKQ